MQYGQHSASLRRVSGSHRSYVDHTLAVEAPIPTPLRIAAPENRALRPARGRPVRVIVVDHDPTMREGIKTALRAAGLIVTAEAGDGQTGIELALHYRPDIVLLDISVPGWGCLQATRDLVRRDPEIAVILLSTSEDPELGVVALRAGARGVRRREESPAMLAQAVDQVLRGEVTVHPGVVTALVDRVRRFPENGCGLRPVESPLTSREWSVLDRLTAGRTTAEIAEDLVLSHETVRSHLKHLMRKLDVHSRGEAIAAARRLRPFD